MSKFGPLISQAKGNLGDKEKGAEKKGSRAAEIENKGNSETRKPENQIIEEKSVNLSIKVPERLRRHWVAESKRRGTSITAEVTSALIEKFGSPE